MHIYTYKEFPKKLTLMAAVKGIRGFTFASQLSVNFYFMDLSFAFVLSLFFLKADE